MWRRREDLVESLGSLWRTWIPIKMEISEKISDFKHYFLAGELYISDNFLKIVFLSEIILFWTTNMAKKGLNNYKSSDKNGDVCIFIGTLDVYGTFALRVLPIKNCILRIYRKIVCVAAVWPACELGA